MDTREQRSSQGSGVPHPDIPLLIDSRETEYRGTGITSSVQIFGHPIHPIIVIFPVAFLSGVAGTDLGYLLTGRDFWSEASLWLIGAGLLTAIAAAITGMSDFINIPRVRRRRAGWAHMLLNVGVLVLTIVNLLIRWGNPEGAIVPWGLAISWVVATLLLASGWYGGELMFRHKVGIVGPGETHAS
ncbi:DUF2231 domain-containing protein [Pseudanabaena sp. FACHB-2040]|uniref:DUF2231 domain-containing protein n=1 Tax=Pseudanabaena sp. FACHB-2040 TaxID=2692859 RepID=UPI0016862876|nr:DUF2231 domain-containing protein [Pseudanabaena sp. FACHB-2040]MBD2257975.1 DUF2231 domain-containing protein [Pseudanabaena sp. FACHB-2040]